jgi:hypothetical protein
MIRSGYILEEMDNPGQPLGTIWRGEKDIIGRYREFQSWMSRYDGRGTWHQSLLYLREKRTWPALDQVWKEKKDMRGPLLALNSLDATENKFLLTREVFVPKSLNFDIDLGM